MNNKPLWPNRTSRWQFPPMLGPDFTRNGCLADFRSGTFGVVQVMNKCLDTNTATFLCKSEDLPLREGSLFFPEWMAKHIYVGVGLSMFNFTIQESNGHFMVDGTGHDTILLPHPRSPGVVAEGFGGLGGWAHGARFFGVKPMLVVEIDFDTAHAYAKGHDMPVFTPLEVEELIKQDATPTGFVLHADIQDLRVWRIAAICNVDLWMMSPPCPPWCSSGFQKGLGSHEGQLLIFSIQRAASCGICKLMMENVPNIVKHPDFMQIRNLASKVGLPVVSAELEDCRAVVPCTRKRWMAIFLHPSSVMSVSGRTQASSLKWPRQQPVDGKPAISLTEADCLLIRCSRQQMDELEPSSQQLALMQDPQLLAPWERNGLLSPEAVLGMRTVSPHGIFKAIMASYGSQDELPLELLMKSGLHTLVLADKQFQYGVRMICPWEFLSSMGFPPTCFLPADIRIAWRMTGNALSPVHAVLCCLRLTYLIRDASPFQPSSFDLAQFARNIQENAIKLSVWKEAKDQQWRWLEPSFPAIEYAEISPTLQYNVEDDFPQINQQGLFIVATGLSDVVGFESVQKHLHSEGEFPEHDGFVPWFVSHKDGIVCQGGWTIPRQSVGKLLVLVWPHLTIEDTCHVWLNGVAVSWSDICIKGPIHIEVELHKCNFSVSVMPMNQQFLFQIDAAWTVADVKGYVGCLIGLLPKQLSLWQGHFQLDDDEIVLLGIDHKCVVTPNIEFDPCLKCLKPKQLAVPPVHSDSCIPVGRGFTRFSVRHPIWATVRTVAATVDFSVLQLLSSLMPDFCTRDLQLQCGDQVLPFDMSVGDLPGGELDLCFLKGNFPMQSVFRRTPMSSFTLAEAVGLRKRWIRSPFNNKAQIVDTPDSWSLCEVAAAFFVPTNSAQTLMVVVNGSHADPRTLVKDIDTEHIIGIRACALVGGAKKPEIKNVIRRLLISHGVPDSNADSRVEVIVSGIGLEKLRSHEAEDLDQFWGSLKKLASENRIRLISQTELRDFQKLKRANASVSSNANAKAAGKGANKEVLKIPPIDQLVFSAKHFIANDDQVPIIPNDRFGPDAHGITIMSVKEATKHVATGCISLEALAILAVGVNAESLGNKILVPAHSKDGSPLLVPCTLLQHGEVMVEFQADTPAANTVTIDTITLEFTIRRSMTSQWEATATPLHFLGVQCPELRSSGRVISTWSIRAYKERKAVAFTEAQHWHGYIRLDAEGIEAVLRRSGQNGIFFTPRGSDHKPDTRFAVIALPGKSVEAIKSELTDLSEALGIAVLSRSFDQFGVRCRREHHDIVRQHFFPETLHIDSATIEADDQLFVIRHLSAQFSREGMDRALNAVGWIAKAVKPLGADAWLIASQTVPPSEHLCINGALAVVTTRSSNKAPPVVLTRTHTVTRLGGQKDGNFAITKHSRVDEMKADLSSQLEGMIEKRMQATSDKINHLTGALEETRLQLQACQEAHRQELQQVRVDQAQTCQKVGDLENAIQTNTGSLLSQMKAMLTGFHQENAKQIQGLQTTLNGQVSDLQTELSGRIENIEREANKKLKTGPSPKKS